MYIVKRGQWLRFLGNGQRCHDTCSESEWSRKIVKIHLFIHILTCTHTHTQYMSLISERHMAKHQFSSIIICRQNRRQRRRKNQHIEENPWEFQRTIFTFVLIHIWFFFREKAMYKFIERKIATRSQNVLLVPKRAQKTEVKINVNYLWKCKPNWTTILRWERGATRYHGCCFFFHTRCSVPFTI